MATSRNHRRSSRRRRRGRRLRVLAPVAVLAAVAAVIVSVADGDPPATVPKSAIRIDIGAAPISRPVPAGYVGLSIEYYSALYYFGTDPAHPDPVFAQLVRNLNPGSAPVLRIGGDSTDWTWWPTSGVPRPLGVRYTLTPRWLASTRAEARALGARLILGINFEADSPAIAGTEARHMLAGIGAGSIAGFELGNEPEVYGTLGWYPAASGAPVLGRPPSYSFRAYLPDYARVEAALPRSVPVVGPASGSPAWLTGLGTYLSANPRVRIVTFHRYPLHRCFTPRTSPAYPSLKNLLAPISATGPADSLADAVRVAHAHGLPLRSDELNSVSCSGARGVSNTFASALWMLDTLFNMARVGVDGVNVHTFANALYEPFSVSELAGVWHASVKPMYYGMLLFAQAAPPGSRLLATPLRTVSPLSIWATRAPGGRVHVVLINDALRRSVLVAVRPPGHATTATARILRAPHIRARSGVTYGGQSFGTDTTSGLLGGPRHSLHLSAIQRRFVVRLPPGSATLVTVGGR